MPRPGVFDCGCFWDGRSLNVAAGCEPKQHEPDLGANFVYVIAVPPREDADGPEGLMWSEIMHGDIVGPMREDVRFNWTAPAFDDDEWGGDPT